MDKNDFKEYIFKKLNEYYLKNNRTVRKQTIKVYVNKISKLHELLNLPYSNISFCFIFEKTEKDLEKLFININSRATYLSALIMWLKANDIPESVTKPYTELLFTYSKIKKEFQKNKIKKELRYNKYDLEKLKTKYEEELKTNKSILFLQKYLIFNLYNGEWIAPVRADYNKVLIMDEWTEDMSKDFNFYCKKSNCFIFRNYKTSSKKGDVIVKCPSGLVDILELAIPLISVNKFLIINRKTDHLYNANTFGKIVKKTFDGITICDLRKIYLTEKFEKLKEILSDLDECSRCMMNSTGVCLDYYIHDLKHLKK